MLLIEPNRITIVEREIISDKWPYNTALKIALIADVHAIWPWMTVGHTHRGQIRFPFIGALETVIPSKFGKRFHYGHIKENSKDLVVSDGLGTTGLPLRLLAPPEITVITLKSKN